MKLNVGSKNKNKVEAVKEAAALYPDLFPNPEVVSAEITIEQFGHPKSLDETVQGALNRAKEAFANCSYSFGLESGLMAVPHTKTGYMEVGVCAIYDGKNFHLGLSTAFEWPKQIFELIVNQGLDGSQAVKATGLSDQEKVGAANGVINILTKGQTTRKDQIKASVLMAIIHLNHPDLF